MRHGIKPIPFKPPRLIRLSERLLASHYENNYGGAVRRLNAIETRLAGFDWSSVPGFEINSENPNRWWNNGRGLPSRIA